MSDTQALTAKTKISQELDDPIPFSPFRTRSLQQLSTLNNQDAKGFPSSSSLKLEQGAMVLFPLSKVRKALWVNVSFYN